jgi:hypothetical protein
MSNPFAQPDNLPARVQPLVNAQAINADSWQLVRDAVRPDLATPYLDKVPRAINAGLNDAAITYIWNMVEEDLRRKIIAYGIDYFGAAINKSGLRTRDDLADEVKSIQLLEGCLALGIISKEAHFFLDHCRGIRNQFSAAHMAATDLDNIETGNYIKNCVKYVLGHDLPPAGFSIKEFQDHIAQPGVDLDEAFELLSGQSSRIYGAVAHSFFAAYIESATPNDLRGAIRKLAPRLWELLDDDLRFEVAMRYASLKARPTPNHADQALDFLKAVNGFSYIPTNLSAIIFQRYAQGLLDAYSCFNNFHLEPAPARALLELGMDVPIQAAKMYSKAILLSFVGNRFGYSWGASGATEKMFGAANATVMSAIRVVLRNDPTVLLTLLNSAPAKRFKELAPILRVRATETELVGLLDEVVAKEWNFVVNEMRRRYDALQVEK